MITIEDDENTILSGLHLKNLYFTKQILTIMVMVNHQQQKRIKKRNKKLTKNQKENL